MAARSLILAAVIALAATTGLSRPVKAEPFHLSLPLACKGGTTCFVQNYVDTDPGPGARDYRCGGQTYQGHNGVDIRLLDMAAQKRGVNVLAAAPGTVLRLRDSAPDISIRAAGAPSVVGQECGNGLVIDHGDGWETQYCHMAQGSLVVKPGQKVARGDVLGRVGLSGMTEFPHLHITVRHNGVMVDPFGPRLAPGTCSPIAGESLWEAGTRQALSYRAGEVLNAGFSGVAPSMDGIEQAGLAPPARSSAIVFAYVRALHLKVGDVQVLTVTGPGGGKISQARLPPLDKDKAQTLVYAGARLPAGGWPPGTYVARYQVLRNGSEVVVRTFSQEL